MVVLSEAAQQDQVDSQIRALRYDVVRRHAARKLQMLPEDVKNHHLAQLFGLSIKSISRIRNRRIEPSLDTAMHISEVLGVLVEDIVEHTPRAGVR